MMKTWVSSWSSTILLIFSLLSIISGTILTSFAESGDPLQDTCPTSPTAGPGQGQQEAAVFMNGFPCKNPAAIVASDFKSSDLNRRGDTDNFIRSSMNIITAAKFPGLNTLGLSISRTDVDVDGMVLPHSHPRASELMYVSEGVVVVGFVGTGNRMFQKTLEEGDVFVIPRGLLHFSLNAGFEIATVFSVLNSQNPGVVNVTEAMFGEEDTYLLERLMSRLRGIFLPDSIELN
ncbi:hypothetical protein NE237_020484 [Protea cynaroides]|uniref:Germin-like protein n=1 Tax=Protea cynaroides TaxID=273540 RepID=A0A9Q0K1P6_9MAGN|nr:hypothetical protein NE237_020484 [Protea cynaroides]